MAITLSNPRFAVDADNYPYIAVEIDGHLAKVPLEQKAAKDGFIFVGSDFEDVLPVLTLPAAPGRLEMPLRGFSDDSRLLALYRQFAAEVDSQKFQPRQVALPKS